MELSSSRVEPVRLVRALLCLQQSACGLCGGAGVVQLHDEVAVRGAAAPLELRQVLAAVVGGVMDSEALPENLCAVCAGAATASYSFLQLCRGYARVLGSVAELVQTGAELPTRVYHPGAHSLFLLLDPKENIMFIDRTGKTVSTKKALSRLKCLIRRKDHDVGGREQNREKTKSNRAGRKKHIFQCSHCSKTFWYKQSIERHLPLCMGEPDLSEKVSCTFAGCNVTCTDNYALRMHVLRVHTEKKYPCATCGKLLASPRLVDGHIKAKHAYRECQACGKGFAGSRALTRHRFRDHPDLSTADVYGYDTPRDSVKQRQYFCTFPACDKMFRRRFMLLAHIKRNHKGRLWPCAACPKMFASPVFAKVHFNSVHQPRECRVCQQVCIGRKSLWVHESTHKDPSMRVKKEERWTDLPGRLFICSFVGCNRRYLKRCLLREHHLRAHEEQKYPCSQTNCFKKFGSPALAEQHFKSAHRLYECRVCHEPVIGRTFLWRHESAHKEASTTAGENVPSEKPTVKKVRLNAPAPDEQFACPVAGCDGVYPKRSRLKMHLKRVHEEKKYPCSACRKMFGSPELVIEHFNSRHLQLECSVCHERVEGRKRLWEHGKTHKELDSQQRNSEAARKAAAAKKARSEVICDMCGRMFSRIAVLSQHMKRAHGPPMSEHASKSQRKVKRIKQVQNCELCKYSTKQQCDMVTHMSKVHLGEEGKYLCRMCGKRFFKKYNLIRHVLTHARERPERCELCDKRFVNKAALLYHTRLHTGERPYECGLCGERFLSASRRGAHVRSKHNPRPQCPICKSTYSNNQVLQKHIQKQHTNSNKSVRVRKQVRSN